MFALGGGSSSRGGGGGQGKRKINAGLRGVEPDPDAPKKCPRTQLDLSGLGVGTGRPANHVWLIKVPSSLYETWMTRGADTELGRLVVAQNEKGEEMLEVRVTNREGADDGVRPRKLPNYSLSSMRECSDSIIFSQSKEGLVKGGGVHIGGEVVRTYTMQPVMGSSYKGLMQQRLVSSTLKDQYVKQVENHKLLHRGARMSGPSNFELGFREREMQRQAASSMLDLPPTGRRERMEPAALRSKLFELFSKKERYLFKDINSLLQQPEDHLKQVLREISNMHRAGPYRNQYELKVEFKAGAK